MRKILWLLLLLVGLGGSASAQSYEKIQLYCEKGGETVTTDGRTSTTRVQRSYPSCTVTVYNGGTLTLASIASDSIGTPKSNPFTADSDGYISFYATDGTYDVKMSGSGLSAPITRSGFWVITSAGGGSGITGSGTINRFPIFTSSSAIGNSVFQQVGTSEFAPAAIGKRINLGTGSQQVVEIANASVTGTTQNRIAKLTGAPSTAVIATTSDTTKLVGIVIAGAGTTGNAQIVTNGNVSCEFDGATTAGNYVGASTTTNGKCTDLGATWPVSGVQVIGRVLQTIGSAGNADVFIFTGEQGRGGVSGSGTTAYLSYWTSSSALGATNSYYDTLNNLYTFGGNVDVANLGNSELTIETDQIIFKGGVSRANNAIMQTMKATATQTGDFQRFTTSAGAARFRVDIDGDVLPRGVNYTWPASLPASTGCLQITSAGVMSVVSCVSGTGVRYALNIKQSPYNCVGDGVTDDTSCFQTAINDAAAAGGYMVYAPAATYKVTGLSVPGGVTLEGDGMQKTIIYSTTNAIIVSAVEGTGSYAFIGPTIRNLKIKGDKSAGSTQIALRADDQVGPDLYYAQGVFENIQISNAGSHGLYVGNAFSSRFVNIYSDDNTGFPFYINAANMPSNHYESLYAQATNATANAGFRVAAGSFICISCNGINASAAGSWNAIIGQATASGDASDVSAFAHWINCNFESALAGGIDHRYNSVSTFTGKNQFAGDGSASGSYIAIRYSVDNALFPAFFSKGKIDDSVTFANSPASFYANSQPIHANDLPPLTVDGQGPKIAGGAAITGYRNTTSGTTQYLYRADAYYPTIAVTTSTSFNYPGPRYFEVTCASNCTLTLPWPGWYQPSGELVIVKNLSATGVVVTLAANSGGTVNGSTLAVSTTGQAVSLLPDATALDWRVISSGLPSNTATNQDQAINVKVDYGCVANGVANDTTCVAAALAAAVASTGKKLYFPNGTYLIDTGTLTLATNGIIIYGDAPGKTIIKARNGTSGLITIDASAVNPHSIVIRDLTLQGFGSGASNNGITISGANTPFNLQFQNIHITGFTGRGLYDTSGMFQSRIENVVISMASTGNNAFDLIGSNDLVLINNYVTTVANSTAAYRIHSGRPTLIGNNGVNPGSTNGSWGVFGNITAEDGSDSYVFATLIGNNVEDFTQYGMRFKEGSFGSFYGNTFLAPASGTVTPLKFDFVDNGQRGFWDATNTINTLGASYTNGNALNSRGAPFTQIGGNDFTTYYDTSIVSSMTFPYTSPQLVAGSTNIAMLTTRAQITALESSGLVGDFTGSTSFAGDAARILLQDGTAARPTYTFSGDTNTGFYRAGADSIGLAANGAAVGSIGTTGLTLGVPGSVAGAAIFGNSSNANTLTLQAGVTASSITYTLPTADGSSGHCLKTNGSGVLSFSSCAGVPSLTATYVAYGDGSNLLTGTSDLAYNTTTKTLTITSAASGVIDLATTSTNSAFKLNGATHPGTAGGLILPFVGGGNGDAPGLWWTSSASYATTSGLFLSNGFNFQGASGTHDNLKINQGTASSSTGTTRYTFAPSSSLFTQNLSTGLTASTHDAMQLDLTSSGGAGGSNFGAGWLWRLENASSSLANAARISVNWTTATAAAETSRIVFATNQSGGGLGDSFTIEGDQHYGVLWDKGNISGAVTLDFINGNTVTATLTGNVTSLSFSNLKTGGVYYIHFIQNALGPWTLAVPAALKVNGGYTITASVNARDLLICSATSTTQLYCAKAQNQQ